MNDKLDEAFDELEDDIVEIQQQNEETEKLFQEEQERLNSNEALKEAMEN